MLADIHVNFGLLLSCAKIRKNGHFLGIKQGLIAGIYPHFSLRNSGLKAQQEDFIVKHSLLNTYDCLQ